MAYQFNLFSSPLEATDTVVKFEATGELPLGYEVWIEGTGLTHDAVTGQFGGTITAMKLYDPNAGGVGDAVQTITFDGDPLAAVNAFTANAVEAYDATVALGVFDPPFARLGEGAVGAGGTELTLELLDGAGQLLGYLRLTGTNFDQSFELDGPGSLSDITQLEKLDVDGVTVLDTQAVSFNVDEFSYGMLKHFGIANLGNGEAIYHPFVDSGVSIATNGYTAFDGGAAADTFVSGIGGHVSYSQSAAAVDIDLDAGTATVGAVVDTWTPGSFGAANGSIFDDTMTGGGFDSWLRGDEGNDLITGQQFHDDLEGDGGNDTINGGDGDDWLFGGAGDDTIDGGLNVGTDLSKETYRYEDTLTYSRVVTSHYNALDGSDRDFAQLADEMLTGITVTYTGTGTGTVTGADTGTDTFTGIELIYGSRFADVFDASGAIDGDFNIFTGMGWRRPIHRKRIGLRVRQLR